MSLSAYQPGLSEKYKYLGREGPEPGHLNGAYFYDRHREDIYIEGERDAQGKITLREYGEPGLPPTAIFRGTFENGVFHGDWQSVDGKRSLPFRLAHTRKFLWTGMEEDALSKKYQELAALSLERKESAKAIYYLRLLDTHRPPFRSVSWETLLGALIDGTADSLRPWLASCDPARNVSCEELEGLRAFFAEQDEDLAAAKKLLRGACEPRLGNEMRTFNCVMYASLGKRTGDRAAELEGYDFGCGPLTCSKARGPDELALIAAIKDKKSQTVEELLKKPVNVNAQEGAVLEAAVLNNDVALVRELLKKGADPNRDGGTALSEAANNNFQAIVDELLDHGVSDLTEALHYAALNGNVYVVERLLAKGVDVNDNNMNASTALILACEQNHLEVVKVLLAHGADPTLGSKFHDVPLKSTTNPAIKKLLNAAIAECKRGERKCSYGIWD